MNKLLLVEHFKIMPLIDHLNAEFGVIGLKVSTMSLFFNQALFLPDLLNPFLQSLK